MNIVRGTQNAAQKLAATGIECIAFAIYEVLKIDAGAGEYSSGGLMPYEISDRLELPEVWGRRDVGIPHIVHDILPLLEQEGLVQRCLDNNKKWEITQHKPPHS